MEEILIIKSGIKLPVTLNKKQLVKTIFNYKIEETDRSF